MSNENVIEKIKEELAEIHSKLDQNLNLTKEELQFLINQGVVENIISTQIKLLNDLIGELRNDTNKTQKIVGDYFE